MSSGRATEWWYFRFPQHFTDGLMRPKGRSVLWWTFCNCLFTVNNSAGNSLPVDSVGLCFVRNCLAPGLKTKPFVNYCNLVNGHFPFSPKFRSWLFQLEIKWNGPFRNVVFPAQAEYSYCFDDFKLKILFYYSFKSVSTQLFRTPYRYQISIAKWFYPCPIDAMKFSTRLTDFGLKFVKI